MSQLLLDAESLYLQWREALRPALRADGVLLGIHSGGAWLAERLAADLQRPCGVISSTLHRDDFHARGLSRSTDATRIPYAVDGAHILLIDDVLATGRTVRAVLNELYDYGRPASVRLAVLVDRGGRELPFCADHVAASVALPANQRLRLKQAEGGALTFEITAAGPALEHPRC